MGKDRAAAKGIPLLDTGLQLVAGNGAGVAAMALKCDSIDFERHGDMSTLCTARDVADPPSILPDVPFASLAAVTGQYASAAVLSGEITT